MKAVVGLILLSLTTASSALPIFTEENQSQQIQQDTPSSQQSNLMEPLRQGRDYRSTEELSNQIPLIPAAIPEKTTEMLLRVYQNDFKPVLTKKLDDLSRSMTKAFQGAQNFWSTLPGYLQTLAPVVQLLIAAFNLVAVVSIIRKITSYSKMVRGFTALGSIRGRNPMY